MKIDFRAIAEQQPGPKWRALCEQQWPRYQRWFHSEGDAARPTYAECVRNLKQYMPELMPTYECLTDLAGGGDSAARFLSMYCPPPYLSGCTQAVWTGDEPMLVRNYDYSWRLLEGIIWMSAWNGRKVIAMSDGLWGALDGMNESGLAVSLAFGGRLAVGKGFGIPLILRYVLEFCQDTPSAVDLLRRVPVHMSYNITVVDRAQRFCTVFVAPDRRAIVRQVPVATNHQGRIEWPRHAWATATLEREHAAASRLADSDETAQGLIAGFLQPPLFNTAHDRGFGTLYTAVYRAESGAVQYLWPGQSLDMSLDNFSETSLVRHYNSPAKVSPPQD
jgi:predicted choloylglycine hydrolase